MSTGDILRCLEAVPHVLTHNIAARVRQHLPLEKKTIPLSVEAWAEGRTNGQYQRPRALLSQTTADGERAENVSQNNASNVTAGLRLAVDPNKSTVAEEKNLEAHAENPKA